MKKESCVLVKPSKWNILVYVHAALLLWAVLFICGLLVFSKTNFVFAFGNFFFLFVNIPLAILSFVLMSKDYIDIKYKVPTAVLSVLNIIVGISAWYFVILLIQEANLG